MSAALGTIGYWARTHDLTWDDVVSDDDLRSLLDEADSTAFQEELSRCGGNADAAHVCYQSAKTAFKAGWDECDEELRDERITNLKASLMKSEVSVAQAQGLKP